MYLDHFGLSQPPFKITPNTKFFFIGGNRGAILEALCYAIIHGEGIVKVTGEIGSGKTMLCRMLANHLPENVEAIYIINPSLNRDDVFYVIANELRLATQGKRAHETLHLIQNYLIERHAAGKQVVLLIEEAQAMPLDTLEEIRLLSNLETEQHKLLQIVLFGQLNLDDNLALPRMRQLKERITHSFTVPPLTRVEIPKYLMFRMRAAGYHGPDIFSKEALKLIAATSQGIIRRINVLADKALLSAFSENTHNILPRHIKAAITDNELAIIAKKLPLRYFGLTLALLGLGIFFWSGGSFTNLPPKDATPPVTSTVQAEPVLTVPPPTKKISLPITVAPPAHNQLQARLAATQLWLAKENGANLTLQLILLTDTGTGARAGDFLRRLEKEIGLTQIYIYQTRITADNQLRITYGNFPSEEQALAAFAAMPVIYQRNGPVLRTVQGIRNEIAKQQEL